MLPKISVIIPAHNEEKYLGKTLQSLRQQNFLDYETIIVCNGCTDQTEEVAKKYLNRSTQVLSLEKANVSIARNRGAEHANGKVLLFLDADTSLEPSTLQTISQKFTPEYAVATTLTKPGTSKLKYHLALSFKNFYNWTKIYQGCSGTLICRKKDFNQVEYYPELTVKEHRKLIIKLKKLGKYGVINTRVTTSMRRFEQWGLIKATAFWFKQWAKNYLSDLKESQYETVR
ncbi:glycosyltransferase [Candidatus Woesearchaeota archaeon]|nr:glycosyltransferase [Candidatus Woesearchaeota archaeon]